MIEMILKFDSNTSCHDPNTMLQFWAWLASLPSFEPTRYSINHGGAWVDFDVNLIAQQSCALTSQFLRLETKNGHRLMMSLGRHGEEPTCVVGLSAEGQDHWIEWTNAWPDLFRTVPMFSASITDSSWRNGLAKAGIIHSPAAPHLGLVECWSERAQFEALSPFAVRSDSHEKCHTIWLADHVVLQDEHTPRLQQMHSIWNDQACA